MSALSLSACGVLRGLHVSHTGLTCEGGVWWRRGPPPVLPTSGSPLPPLRNCLQHSRFHVFVLRNASLSFASAIVAQSYLSPNFQGKIKWVTHDDHLCFSPSPTPNFSSQLHTWPASPNQSLPAADQVVAFSILAGRVFWYHSFALLLAIFILCRYGLVHCKSWSSILILL